MTTNNRMIELDVLRGIAVLAVIGYHYTSRYNDLFGHVKVDYSLNFKYGYLGVQLFFIISGFVIFMTIERCKTVSEFAYRRASRLYPAYIIGVVLTYLSVTVYHLEGRAVKHIDALLNLTMLQGLIPGAVENVDGAYWSLTVEIIFYLIMGFLLFIGWINKIEIPIILWLIFSLIIRYSNLYYENVILTGFTFYGILAYCNLFIAGIIFYKLKKENKLIYHIILTISILPEFIFNGMVIGTVVSIFFGFFYLLIYGKLSFLNNKILVFLGTISYALYLVHQNIGYIIINYLEKNGFTHEVYLLVPLSVSIVFASIITFYIERPVLKLLRKKTVRHQDVYNQNQAI